MRKVVKLNLHKNARMIQTNMARWRTTSIGLVSFIHFWMNMCELQTNPILLEFSSKWVWKSDERVMYCEKLIGFKRVFYHCCFDIAKKNKTKQYPKWTTLWCYRPQIWEIPFPEWPTWNEPHIDIMDLKSRNPVFKMTSGN